jgi:hypothetical protein
VTTGIVSRTTGMSRGSGIDSFQIVRMTGVPFLPRILSTASCIVILPVSEPSILSRRSPERMPERAPGVSSMGETTVSMRSLIVITMPTPRTRRPGRSASG